MSKPSNKSPANRVAELRNAKGLTQAQLAELVGAHIVTIANLERSSKPLSRDWIAKLAPHLDADERDLTAAPGGPAKRLQLARSQAGFDSATSAAARFGWNENTYRSHENGQRGLKPAVVEEYAAAFAVTPSWIVFGNSSAGSIRRLIERLRLPQLVVDPVTGVKKSRPSYEREAADALEMLCARITSLIEDI